MTDPTATTIQTRFPEFVDTDSAAIEFAIEEAKLIFGSGTPAVRAPALMYLTAHILSISASAAATVGSGGGNLASVTIGRISRTFAQVSASSGQNVISEYEQTAYGKRYLQLINKGQKVFEVLGAKC
jgi:uncharacterized glyoxalase superfamily protein PhnB